MNVKDAINYTVDFMEKDAAEKKKMKPYLDKQLWAIQKTDNKIKWFENKIKELEEEKQLQLKKMGEYLDLAMQSSHSLKNGFTVMPDNKRKVEVTNTADFLKWLKANRKPQEVMSFFEGALKLSNLKSFCNKEANLQTEKGTIEPKIDGVEFGEITYRRLTTCVKEKK